MSGFILGAGTPSGGGSAPSNAETLEFLRRVLPTPGPARVISINSKFLPADATRPIFPGKGFDSYEAAANHVAYWQKRSAEKNNGIVTDDFYYTTSLIAGAELVPGNSTHKRYKVSRKSGFAARKEFCADLDVVGAHSVKGKIGYATVQDAIDAIDSLIAKGVLLEPTAWVLSGYGVHLHWVVDTEITNASSWGVTAHALAALLTANGIMHDSNCCVDVVRILRPPGAWNCKVPTSPQRTSLLQPMLPTDYALADIEAMVAAYKTAMRPAAPASSGQPPVVVNGQVQWIGSAVQGNTALALNVANANVVPFPARPGAPPPVSNFSAGIEEHRAQPISFEKVVASCPTFADIHARNGNGDSEPLWSLAILASTFMIDGRAVAHELSKGDPRYTKADTDAKFDQKEADRKASGGKIGWPTCRAFSAHSSHCQSCPLLAHGKSPLNGGKDDSDLPEGYFRRDGVIWGRRREDPNDLNSPMKEMCILAYGVRDAYLENGEHGLAITMEVIHTHHEPLRLSMPAAFINVWQKNALDTLARAHITFRKSRQDGIQEFFVAFLQQLQAISGVVARREQFGWTETRSKAPAFAFGGLAYSPAGQEATGAGDPVLTGIYSPKGSLDVWKAAAKFLTDQGRPELDIVLAVAFAAPLIRFSGVTGVLVSAFSTESGRGKSMAVETALAVWGDPVTGKNKLTDTINQVGRKLGMLRNIPVFWDEIRDEETAKNIAELAFSLTLGSEKGRLNADSSIKHSGSWTTMLVAATNNSIKEIMVRNSGRSSAAGVNRVFEVEVLPIPQHAIVSMDVAQSYANSLRTNHGQAGVVYAEFLAREAPKHEARLAKTLSMFEQATKAVPEERFWLVACATIFLGAAYANQLGLTTFDLAALRTRLIKGIQQQRTSRTENVMDVNSVDYAAEIIFRYHAYCRSRNCSLETNVVPKGPGRGTRTELRMPGPDAARMLRDPKLHLATDDALMRVIPHDFQQWLLTVEKAPIGATLRALETHAHAKLIRVTWAAGTDWAAGQTNVYEWNLYPGSELGKRFDFAPMAHVFPQAAKGGAKAKTP